jgi:large subunit ribosomal protein L23
MRPPEQIIKRPLLTEKGNFLKETGGGRAEPDADTQDLCPQVLFEVVRDANKLEIRHAVEKLWKVDVLKVRTSIVRGKEKRLGRSVGRRANWKKALVTLAPGQNIEFFEGA